MFVGARNKITQHRLISGDGRKAAGAPARGSVARARARLPKRREAPDRRPLISCPDVIDRTSCWPRRDETRHFRPECHGIERRNRRARKEPASQGKPAAGGRSSRLPGAGLLASVLRRDQQRTSPTPWAGSRLAQQISPSASATNLAGCLSVGNVSVSRLRLRRRPLSLARRRTGRLAGNDRPAAMTGEVDDLGGFAAASMAPARSFHWRAGSAAAHSRLSLSARPTVSPRWALT